MESCGLKNTIWTKSGTPSFLISVIPFSHLSSSLSQSVLTPWREQKNATAGQFSGKASKVQVTRMFWPQSESYSPHVFHLRQLCTPFIIINPFQKKNKEDHNNLFFGVKEQDIRGRNMSKAKPFKSFQRFLYYASPHSPLPLPSRSFFLPRCEGITTGPGHLISHRGAPRFDIKHFMRLYWLWVFLLFFILTV